MLSEQDGVIAQSVMPYPTVVDGPSLMNYKTTPRADSATAFSSANGEPGTILRSYAGDQVLVHAINAPSSEQAHVFTLGGLSWPLDPAIPGSSHVQNVGVTPWETLEARVVGGAGGVNKTVGDFFVGDLRRPFSLAGMWGLSRVLSPAGGSGCPIKPLDGKTCTP